MEIIDKIVDFEEYCDKCKYRNLKESEEPCNECLNNTANVHSKKPVKFEARD